MKLVKVKKLKTGQPVEINKTPMKTVNWSDSQGIRVFFQPETALIYVQDIFHKETVVFSTANIVGMQLYDNDIDFLPSYDEKIEMQHSKKVEVDRYADSQAKRVVKQEYVSVPANAGHDKLDQGVTVPKRRKTYKEVDA